MAVLDNAKMSAEALAATKWQDRREAWARVEIAGAAQLYVARELLAVK